MVTAMPIRDRITDLIPRLAGERQFPTQGETLFVDLERRDVRRAFIPRRVIEAFLGGRGVNMYLLHNLLDASLDPLDAEVPMIFGTGILTSLVPSAARGNVTSWSPETRVILDSNAGDYFPSFLKLNGIDRLVLYGRHPEWTFLVVRHGDVHFLPADRYLGLDNIDLRERVAADYQGEWGKDLAMASITRAGENLVKTSGIMAGPKALYARGAPGAKMGALRLKGILVHEIQNKTMSGA